VISITLPALPDRSGPAIPEGLEVAGYTLNDDGQTYTVDVTGPPEVAAAIGLANAADPVAQANRVMFRLAFDRINELARELGREDLLVIEPDAFALIETALQMGLGRPGQRPDV
jgi:hypothetical protein